MGMFYVGTDQMVAGGYASEHDRKIANKIGYVMTGGNLSEQTEVSEQYLWIWKEKHSFHFVEREKRLRE
jgi:3-hydroxyacyl-CoA dehydrogenase